MSEIESLKERVADYIERTGAVTFAELASRFGEPFLAGCLALEWRPGLVMWAGMTSEGADAIDELIRENRIRARPTSPLTYMIDGRGMRLPVAKRNRDYKHPHWLPLVFDGAKETRR